jgi:chromosome partitioning protein
MRVKQKGEAFLNKLNQHYKPYMCPAIRYNNTLSQSPLYGKTIFEYAPGSKGAQDYKELVKRVSNNYDLFS